MGGSSPERAMRELLRQGTASRVGLDELARKVAQRRRELLAEALARRHARGGAPAARRGRAGRAQAARPGPRRRRPVRRDAHGRAAGLPGGGGHRAGRLPLAQRRRPREVRADQGPPRARAARPALRGDEAGPRERHPRGPRARRADAPRPQRPPRRARPGGRHHRAVPRLHGPARRLLPRAAGDRRRAGRRAGRACGRRPAHARLDDARTARRARRAVDAGVRLTRAHGPAVGTGRRPAGAPPGRGLGRVGAVRRAAGAGPR